MKSPHEEDSRTIDQHDPSEVVRAANIFVDEVIAKAQEEALIKYQKRQEEDESAFEEGKFPNQHERHGYVKIPETASTDKHETDEKTIRTFSKTENPLQHPHPHIHNPPYPLPSEQRSHHLITNHDHVPSSMLNHDVGEHINTRSSHQIPLLLANDRPIPYASSTAFERAHITTHGTKHLILKMFVIIIGCVLMYVLIFTIYKIIQFVLSKNGL